MDKKQKKVKDVDIYREYGVPTRTLQDWKNADKSNWRYKVYNGLKISLEVEQLGE